jgi:hypothetical protein
VERGGEWAPKGETREGKKRCSKENVSTIPSLTLKRRGRVINIMLNVDIAILGDWPRKQRESRKRGGSKFNKESRRKVRKEEIKFGRLSARNEG